MKKSVRLIALVLTVMIIAASFTVLISASATGVDMKEKNLFTNGNFTDKKTDGAHGVTQAARHSRIQAPEVLTAADV